MKNILASITIAWFSVSAHASTLYHYQFETSDPTVNAGSGSATAIAAGSITSTAGGASGNFGDFDGGNVAGSDVIDLNLAGDAISLGSFTISLSINDSSATSYDDFIGFNTSAGTNLVLERQGGALEANNRMTLTDLTNSNGIATAIGALAEGSWADFSVIGRTSGADAVLELMTGTTSNGFLTVTGGASQTLANFRIGGRLGADNRYVEAGIDEVKITNVPEPSSTALLGLGGLALLFRRRK